MQKTTFVKAAALLTASASLAGCQFINPQLNKLKASPTPRATTNPAFATPVPTAQPDAFANPSPTATASGKPASSSNTTITKGGVKTSSTPTTKRSTTTTTTTTTRVNPNYDTSADSIDFTVYPGQSQETEITLYNKTNSKVMFAVKAPEKQSDSFPIKVDGSNEATGTIDAQGKSTFRVSTISSGNAPGFTTTITVNFVSMDNQVAATRTITVSTHTAVGDVTTLDTHTDTEKTGNASMTVTYKPNVAYPFKLYNRHGGTFTWKATIHGIDAKAVALSADNGVFKSGEPWYSTFRFTGASIGDTKQFTIEVVFESEDKLVKETKTITVNINR